MRVRRQRPVLLVVGAVACLAACGRPLEVQAPDLSGEAADACRELVAALPDSVGDQERREVDSPFAAAYGDPPIVIRCGVAEPQELMTRCQRINGVDWYESGDVTTTVGRTPLVEMRVPERYRPLDAEYVDVAEAVKQTTTRTGRCL